MSGFGQQYHPFTATATLVIFAIFLVSGFGSAYINVPFLEMFALPANLVYGTIASSVAIPEVLSEVSLLATYYIISVIVGYIVHEFAGGNSF